MLYGLHRMSRKQPDERTRPQIGDLVEVETLRGLAYAQYTFNHSTPPRYGELVRVLPGLFDARPSDLGPLVRGPQQFWTFFPLGPACAHRIVRIVANEEVPEHARGIPLMRAAGGITRDGRVLNWWLWDGEREWPVGELSEDQRGLSVHGVVDYTMLVSLILKGGWSGSADSAI